ncbi:MAG: hypothetical protein WA982_02665 [Rubrobacteraceae bacterium]
MQTELLQFAGVGVAFLVILILWLRIIYLPARTVERWEDQRPKNRRRRG